MKNVFLLLSVLVIFLTLGCSATSPLVVGHDYLQQTTEGQNADNGLLDPKEQRLSRLQMIQDIQTRQMVDDWDTIWLTDHVSYLSQWHGYVGR